MFQIQSQPNNSIYTPPRIHPGGRQKTQTYNSKVSTEQQDIEARNNLPLALEGIYSELSVDTTPNTNQIQNVHVEVNVQAGDTTSSVVLGCTTTLDYGCKLKYKCVDITEAADINADEATRDKTHQHVELVLTIPVMSCNTASVMLTTTCNTGISSEENPLSEPTTTIVSKHDHIQENDYKKIYFLVDYNNVNYHICIEIAPPKPELELQYYIPREPAHEKAKAISKKLKCICSLFEKIVHTPHCEQLSSTGWLDKQLCLKEVTDINQLKDLVTTWTSRVQVHFQEIYNCCNMTEDNKLLKAMVPSVGHNTAWESIDHSVPCHALDSRASNKIHKARTSQIEGFVCLLNCVMELRDIQFTPAFANDLGGAGKDYENVRATIKYLNSKRQTQMQKLNGIQDNKNDKAEAIKQVKDQRSVVYLYLNCIDYCLVRAVNFLCGVSSDKVPSIHAFQMTRLLEDIAPLDAGEYAEYQDCADLVHLVPTHDKPSVEAACMANFIIKHKYLQNLRGDRLPIALSQNQYYSRATPDRLQLDPTRLCAQFEADEDGLQYFNTVLYGELFMKKITLDRYTFINSQEHTWLDQSIQSDSKLKFFLEKIHTYKF